ncbi:MAG: hypothetical protein R3D98_15250 [Candidatus Krumholzibacteriia bacterium]
MRRTRPAALLIGLLFALALAGCADDSSSPTTPAAEAPVLPDPARLTFDFSFFDEAAGLDQTKAAGRYDHFVNAYLRVALLDLLARLALTPPVTAFAAALHTPPSHQDDGAWIWVYTHVDGDQELRIRLRGLPIAGGVEWELRVTAPGLDNAVWFTGTTANDGAEGAWTFRDPATDPELEVATIAWGQGAAGRFLSFEVLAGEDAGDQLTFFDNDPEYSVTHLDADLDRRSFITWWADGHGSLQVPDHNGGAVACWDAAFMNAACD